MLENCIAFRTISRKRKSYRFLVPCDTFSELEHRPEIIVRDLGSFAVMRRNKIKDTLTIQFTWLSSSDYSIKGCEETVTVPYSEVMAVAVKGTGAEYKTLSQIDSSRPKLVFCNIENLRAAVENPTIRRKLSRALRDNFNWKSSERIEFYNDFTPYSFYFRDIQQGRLAMNGGLILHGQEQMDKAYYGVHT